jgi:hypothetical protein
MARKSEGLTKEEQITWRNLNATVYMLRKRMTFINDPLLRKVFDWQLANEKLIEQKKEILGETK